MRPCADILYVEVVETTVEIVLSDMVEIILAWFVEVPPPLDVIL